MMKSETILRAMPAALDGMLILSPENRFYLTGFSSSDGVLLLTKKGGVFFTDSRYLEAARLTVRDCAVEDVTTLKTRLPALCAEAGAHNVGIEAKRMTVSALEKYRAMLPDVTLVTDAQTDACISALREVKREDEIAAICAAQRIAEAALDHVCGMLRPGLTEKEIALELDFYMLRHGADALSFETIAVCGKKTSMPHGVPGDNRVCAGDFVTMDFGAVVDGYHSDMTRTVAIGSVSDEQKTVYEIVLAAQTASLDLLAPGVSCKAADAAARDVIAAAGYGAYFGHSTGHGVGVEIHEQPNLAPKSEQTLRVGNVVTVEPGIYLPGRFGVRIEDMALITPDGSENLTRADKALRIL